MEQTDLYKSHQQRSDPAPDPNELEGCQIPTSARDWCHVKIVLCTQPYNSMFVALSSNFGFQTSTATDQFRMIISLTEATCISLHLHHHYAHSTDSIQFDSWIRMSFHTDVILCTITHLIDYLYCIECISCCCWRWQQYCLQAQERRPVELLLQGSAASEC